MTMLPSSSIYTNLVAQTLGVGSNDVGTLCNHPNINEWSKYKPIIVGNSVQSVNGIVPYNTGLFIVIDTKSTDHSIFYYKQLNVDNILNSESNLDEFGNRIDEFEDIKQFVCFRLGDFRKYDHSTKKPSLETNVPVVQVAPGQKENGILVLTINGQSLEFIKCMLHESNMFNKIDIDRFVLSTTFYSYNDLESVSSITQQIEAYSPTGYDAIFPFEQPANQTLIYQIPHFIGTSNPFTNIYFDKEDALIPGGQKSYNFVRELFIPTYFQKYAPSGQRLFSRFRDVPLAPVITGIPGLIVRDFYLYCQREEDQGVPSHYSVIFKADGDFRGDLVIEVKFEIYELDWVTKTIGNLVSSTSFTNAGYIPNPSSPDVPTNTTTSLFMDNGIFGENTIYLHLMDPLIFTHNEIMYIDNYQGVDNPDNYTIVDSRIHNFGIKTYITFTAI